MRFLVRWKAAQGMRAITIEGLKALLKASQAVVQTKIDGELQALYFDGQKAYFAALGGGIRTELPVLDEAARALRAHRAGKTVIIGELAGVDEGMNPLHFNDTLSIIRNPKGYAHAHGLSEETALKRIYFHPFELAILGGKKLDNYSDLHTYLENFAKLKSLLASAGYIRPMRAKVGTFEAIQAFYDRWVEERGAEGVVVRRQDGSVYKVKKLSTYDLAVIGVTPGKGRHKGRLGALVMAWAVRTHKAIDYGYAANVGTGLSDQAREEAWRWAQANKATFKDGRAPTQDIVWVKPHRVYEIAWERINPKMVRAYTYADGAYRETEPAFAVSLSKPRVVRRRDDKRGTRATDVRLAQIEDFEKLERRFLKTERLAERVFRRALARAPIALF